MQEFVCVCVRLCACVCVCVSVCACERERESACVCVNMLLNNDVIEADIYVCMYMLHLFHVCVWVYCVWGGFQYIYEYIIL